MVNVITKANVRQEVLESNKPVLIDFWANWCGPCRMLSPVIDEIARERPGIKVCKVNVDEEPELAAQFGIMNIPMVVAMRGGKIVREAVGVRPKEDILAMLG